MFELSKIAWLILAPGNLLLILLVVGLLVGAIPAWRGKGMALAGFAAAMLLAIAATPLRNWPLTALENRFARPEPAPARVDGVIVLGGGIDGLISEARGEPSVAAGGPRLHALIELGRRHPEAKLVFTGGIGVLWRNHAAEAPVARDWLQRAGFDADRVIYEDRARNTEENARLSMALVRPKPGERWLLVTSAYHMPRSVGVFRGIGWEVTPWPVGYLTVGQGEWGFDLRRGLWLFETGVREWIGLVMARLRGRSSEWLPSP